MGNELASIPTESAKQDSTSSTSSTSTLADLMEDASSSSSSSSSLSGPLYELTALMTHLPIDNNNDNRRRGLSKYYQGKSQSFTSLGSVKSLEDLAKKENPLNKRMKLCRSYGGGFCTPKPNIAKKPSSKGASFLARNDLLSSMPMQK